MNLHLCIHATLEHRDANRGLHRYERPNLEICLCFLCECPQEWDPGLEEQIGPWSKAKRDDACEVRGGTNTHTDTNKFEKIHVFRVLSDAKSQSINGQDGAIISFSKRGIRVRAGVYAIPFAGIDSKDAVVVVLPFRLPRDSRPLLSLQYAPYLAGTHRRECVPNSRVQTRPTFQSSDCRTSYWPGMLDLVQSCRVFVRVARPRRAS